MPLAIRHRLIETDDASFAVRSLIVLGIDGAGKTTTVRALAALLRNEGIRVRSAANIAGRRWLTQQALALGIALPVPLQDLCETAIRTANVMMHSTHSLAFAGLTIMDRHLFCQSVLRRLRNLPPGMMLPWLSKLTTGDSLVVVLDTHEEEAFDRVIQRGEDFESLDYLRSSRAEYLHLAAENGWAVIDAGQPTSQIVAELRVLLERGPNYADRSLDRAARDQPAHGPSSKGKS